MLFFFCFLQPLSGFLGIVKCSFEGKWLLLPSKQKTVAISLVILYSSDVCSFFSLFLSLHTVFLIIATQFQGVLSPIIFVIFVQCISNSFYLFLHVISKPLSVWQVNTPRICARLVWAIAEHIDLEGLDPLLADDPDDPLNIIVSNIHKVLFNIDSSADTTNRLQDVQAILLCAQRLGARHPRAGQLLTKELEEFRSNGLADSVNKHQCRLILQRIKYAPSHPESR